MPGRRKSFRESGWVSRRESFGADDETQNTLRSLGYSEEEIGATAGQLPSELGTEERLRLSLRALSAQHSESVQERVEASAPPFNPKLEKTEPPAQDEEEAYRRGRRDERYLRRNDPEYVPPPKKPKPPPAPRRRAAARPDKTLGRLYRRAGGGKKGW